jgi:hypothetical protein
VYDIIAIDYGGQIMKKDVLNYFYDLEKLKLTDNNFNFDSSNHKITYDDSYYEPHSLDHVKIKDIDFYIKKWQHLSSIPALATSKLYHQLGILTPPQQPCILNPDKNSTIDCTITQDVEHITRPTTIAFGTPLFTSQKVLSTPDSQWDYLKKPTLKHIFKKYMTDECFKEFTNMFLLDHLRADTDRHTMNYFLIKKSEKQDKYEGIIAIDLDSSRAIDSDIFSKEDLDNFVNSVEAHYTPQSKLCWSSYADRTTEIRNLIQDNVLSNDQLDLLKTALSTDFPQQLKDLVNQYPIIQKDEPLKDDMIDCFYTPLSYLWQYNRETIGKELEM